MNFIIENRYIIKNIFFVIIIAIEMFLLYKYIKNIKEILKSSKSKKEKIISIFKNPYFIAILLVLYPIIMEGIFFVSHSETFIEDLAFRMTYRYGFVIIIFGYRMLSTHTQYYKKILDFIVDNRFKIAALVFVVLVLFKVNFSSIGKWWEYTGETGNMLTIGESRGIRADEWIITTPFNLSQTYVDYARENENVNIGNNDMNIFHAPVLDLSAIVRVQNWGYFLFGNEYGLSWKWCLKLISMLLVFFEFGMMITKKDKGMSLLTAIWLTFSPAIMWWSMLELFVFAIAIIVLFNKYITNTDYSLKKKILLAYGILVFSCNFVFALYPAWQVPLLYVILCFVIIDFIRYRKNLKKQDYIIMACTIVAIIGMLCYFVITSWNGIVAIMSTKYPGARTETGGDFSFKNLLNYYINFFTPYIYNLGNESELAAFIYPVITVGILMIGLMLEKIQNKNKIQTIEKTIKNKDNWYIYGILVLMYIFIMWLGCRWPTFLAKITGLSFSPTLRTAIVFEFCIVILTILIAYKIFNRKNRIIDKKLALLLSLSISIITFCLLKRGQFSQSLSTSMICFVLIVIFIMNYTLLSSNKKAFIYWMIVISLIAGACINPITIGTKIITDTEVATKIREIAEEDKEAIWIGNHNVEAQYLIANGIKTLNGINEYPNYEWINKLDPEHIYETVWNRYANIVVMLDDECYFELILTDRYHVHLTYENLKDLNIKYYYSYKKLNKDIINLCHAELIYEKTNTDQYIYKFNY